MPHRSPIDQSIVCRSPDETFDLGTKLADELREQDVVLLRGGLGAGKTLLTKGILHGLDFDTDEVTSPSFALVNLYPTEKLDVYHVDLWRIEKSENAAFEIGLDEILAEPNAIVIVEWAERLGNYQFNSRVFDIHIEGDGDDPRAISVNVKEHAAATSVK